TSEAATSNTSTPASRMLRFLCSISERCVFFSAKVALAKSEQHQQNQRKTEVKHLPKYSVFIDFHLVQWSYFDFFLPCGNDAFFIKHIVEGVHDKICIGVSLLAKGIETQLQRL